MSSDEEINRVLEIFRRNFPGVYIKFYGIMPDGSIIHVEGITQPIDNMYYVIVKNKNGAEVIVEVMTNNKAEIRVGRLDSTLTVETLIDDRHRKVLIDVGFNIGEAKISSLINGILAIRVTGVAE